MPSQPNAILGQAHARHLLRRAAFAPTPKAVAFYETLTRQEAADRLVDYKPSRFRPNSKDIQIAHGRWIKYMIRTGRELQEKLVLFWHDHFATGNDKVLYPQAMSLQNRTLRRNSNGNFKAFVNAINVDPAMMEYLDTQRNRRSVPNENYARELMELFTLGVKDLNGWNNYKQVDVFQIARAFTGWRYEEGKLTSSLRDGHDYMANYPARGPKVLFGTPREDGGPGNTGGFGSPQPYATAGEPPIGTEGAGEIGQVIDVIFSHKDSDGESTVARFITHKLLSYFCYDAPDKALVDEVIGEANFATDGHPNQWELKPLLKAILANDAFYASAATPPYSSGDKKSIRWPADYVVSTMRLLNMRLKSRYPYIVGGDGDIWDQLAEMGQILFEPPSVFGWDWETSWISSTTLLARYGFARDLIAARDGSGRGIFRPEKFKVRIGNTDVRLIDLKRAGDILDGALQIVAMQDLFNATERSALIDYLTDGDPAGEDFELDLATDYQLRNTKLHGLFGLILQSPHYQLL
jgi:uncharacterized protein (DUF1800 family)